MHDLAKRYLDLWQDQLRAMAADPDMMAAFGRMLAAATGRTGGPSGHQAGAGSDRPADGEGRRGMPVDPFAWWQTAAALPTLTSMGGATPFDSVFAAARTAVRTVAEAGSPAAAAASDGGGDELHDLERRLAALEARLAALESGPRPGRGRAKAKPRNGGR